MALGQFFMFMSANVGADGGTSIMWLGLTAIIIGNGFFKPNISTMVGQLYPAGDRRIDSAFTIFYMGINLGAVSYTHLDVYKRQAYDFTFGIITWITCTH